MSVDRVLLLMTMVMMSKKSIAIFAYKQRILSIEMKTKVVFLKIRHSLRCARHRGPSGGRTFGEVGFVNEYFWGYFLHPNFL